MSLPTAPRDISDKPKAGAVTDPVNKKEKDADVDRKLRLYGVIEAFRQGRYPDNQQIDETLKYVHDNSPVDTSKLSSDGQKLIQDVRDIVETARQIVKEKNRDELFQNFLWHTRGVDADRGKVNPNEAVPFDQEKARQDGQQAVQHLRTLLTLVLTNSEARKLLADFAVIGRDLFAVGAGKAAELARPDPERLAHTNEAAPKDEFVTEGGRKIHGPSGETPVLEARVPVPGQQNDVTIKQHPHNELGTGAEIQDPQGNVRSGAQARDEAANVGGQGKQRAQQEGQRFKEDVGTNEDDNEKKDVAKNGFRERLQGMRDNLMDRVPQQHKDKAGDHYERSKHFLLEEYFPEERRDQFIYRAKKVIVECQRHDDYQASIKWLLGFIEEYNNHAQTAAAKGGKSQGALRHDPALTQALSEIRTLLERFANGKSFDTITQKADVLYQDARNDDQLRAWFKEIDAYARRTLLEPGYVLQEACNEDGRRLRDSGRQFYDGKHKSAFDDLFSAIGDFFTSMGDDPLNARFGEDWARLTRDLLFDSEGSLKFKPELWGDIRRVILPTIVDKIGYVPIPRVEYTDEALDLVLENITLSGRNLFPNVVTLDAHNFIKFSPYDSIKDESHHDFTLHFSQVQADIRDVAFYFHKKTGPIKIKDSGLADVLLGGEGLSATVHLSSSDPRDKSSVFKVKSVNVKVDTLKFSIRDSKHDTLYNTLRPLAMGLVKKQIKRAFEGAIRTGLEYFDGQLVVVRSRMEEAKKTDETTRMQVLQELFQKKKDEAQSVKSEGSKGQFKVVSKRDSAILPDHGHPTGWVNRQAERAEAAAKGQEWRSKAFTIV